MQPTTSIAISSAVIIFSFASYIAACICIEQPYALTHAHIVFTVSPRHSSGIRAGLCRVYGGYHGDNSRSQKPDMVPGETVNLLERNNQLLTLLRLRPLLTVPLVAFTVEHGERPAISEALGASICNGRLPGYHPRSIHRCSATLLICCKARPGRTGAAGRST